MSIIVATAGASLLAPGLAAADPRGEVAPVMLKAGQYSDFRDENGEALLVRADSEEIGERTVVTESRLGERALITIQSAPVNSLHSLEEVPIDVPDPGFVAENSGPVVEERLSDQLSLDPSDWQIIASTAVTRTSVTLRWDASIKAFDGYIDGAPVGTSSDGSLTIRGLTPGKSYAIELQGWVSGSPSQDLASTKTIQLRTLGDDTHIEADRMTTGRTYQAWTTAFMHKTFIPQSSVDGSMCNWNNSAFTFKGDNRDFKLPDATAPFGTVDYRTMMFANINWDNAAPYTVVTASGVGLSVTQNNGSTVASSYADMSNMKFEEIQSGGAYAQVRFNHTASNPHCSLFDVSYGGAIRYNEIVRFYRSGTVEVVGYRHQAPRHEGYARFSNASGAETWTPVFRLGNTHFMCLLASLCAPESINYSKSY
jgi:hypothetical protein